MKVDVLSLSDGSVIAPSITELSFGTVRRGQHCDSPVLIKLDKTVENEITGIRMFLQDDGGLTGTQFGYYTSEGFTGGIDHTNLLVNHFDREQGLTGGWPAAGYTGVDLGVTGGLPNSLIWLDVEVGAVDPIGTSQANYRFVYDFN